MRKLLFKKATYGVRVALLPVACAAILVASPVMAGNPVIGNYAFTGTDVCIASRSGFDPVQGTSLDADGGITWTASVSGIATFSSGGSGKITQTWGAVASEGGGAFNATANGTVAFTYAMVTDGQFSLTESPGTNVGTFTSGPFTGTPYLFSTMAPWMGFVAGGGGRNHQLTMATAPAPGLPIVESWALGKTWQAVCSRNRTLVKIDADDTN